MGSDLDDPVEAIVIVPVPTQGSGSGSNDMLRNWHAADPFYFRSADFFIEDSLSLVTSQSEINWAHPERQVQFI